MPRCSRSRFSGRMYEERIDGTYHCSGVLAVEGRDRLGCRVRVGVLLEVDQAAGEDEDVTGVQGGGEESVCSRGEEPTSVSYKVHTIFHCLYIIRTDKRLPGWKGRTLFTAKARGEK
jgi:hypothetical protein